MSSKFSVRCFFVALVSLGCSKENPKKAETLFELLPSDSTSIAFSNNLKFDQDFNIYTYRNFYNGGGVALGDINNDGLLDVYLTANQTSNKLFLNKGDFKFEDITDKANVGGKRAWSTGVSVADVNGDGWLDIYVCNSGDVKGDNKLNELFINNHDLTFTERAQEFGVADSGFTTHAVFFDYDKDGDLDLYILNNSYQAIGSFNLRKNERPKRDSLGGDKLMRNDGNHFVDVSEQAGIYGSIIGFGLGVTVGDVNKDGWQDIYVSNDFFERDYLYLNNRKGGFDEVLTDEMRSISGASMGADLADVNNDGYADIFVTEMLPHDNARIKTVTTFEDWNRYQYNLQNGYYHQFTRNMLQANRGNGKFSEVGRLSGVEATDWSWGALIFDMDNDGQKDIFIANGIYQDLTNQDFLQYASSEEFVKSVVHNNKVNYKQLVDIIPSTPVANYAFHNNGNYSFTNLAIEWGLAELGFSNGSAYGDLDNDGDLDLVVNNVNMPCFVYRNQTNKQRPQNHYLKFILKGSGNNTQALGTKITITSDTNRFYLEQMPMRGFESTVDARPNFGLGNLKSVDHIRVDWPDGSITELDSVSTNQIITLNQRDGKREVKNGIGTESVKILDQQKDLMGIDFIQQENPFVDFDRDRLVYHMLSTQGPKMAKGDINGDGLEDLFIGGAKDQASVLYVQLSNGRFQLSNVALLDKDKASEDMASVFFDADNDGDQDLYVCSGGNEYPNSSSALIDRLYINDGKGTFTKSNQLLPTSNFESSSSVKAADYDGDGDIDLFVGIRVRPFQYGLPCNGYVLSNDGTGKFTNVTAKIAPALLNIGMITDASWADIDGDKDLDLIVVGEWMAIQIFVNEKGMLTKASKQTQAAETKGWWNAIQAADVDGDGDMDFVLGNHGLNSRFRAQADKPICMYVNDFDKNGSIEQIICQYVDEVSYPVVLRHDLISQLPAMKKKYLKYESFKDQRMDDMFTPEEMAGAVKLEATEMRSGILKNNDGEFVFVPLPTEAQVSPVYGIYVSDLDGDGTKDILLGGNLYNTKPEIGRYDASYGTYLKGVGKGRFVSIAEKETGLLLEGEVRAIEEINIGSKKYIVVARNGDSVQLFKLKK